MPVKLKAICFAAGLQHFEIGSVVEKREGY
jgi:hypothetical protein